MQDLGSGVHQGQQQYYMQSQQPDYSNYNNPPYYPESHTFDDKRNDSHTPNEYHPKKSG